MFKFPLFSTFKIKLFNKVQYIDEDKFQGTTYFEEMQERMKGISGSI